MARRRSSPKHEEDRPLSAEEWPLAGNPCSFVSVPEGKAVKNRMHLDLAPHTTGDWDALIESLLGQARRG